MGYMVMVNPVTIVDLFSGPGGLAEGFSECRGPAGEARYSVGLSVEKEPSAHRTLLLRAFLRKFDGKFPSEYYDFLNGVASEPDWQKLYPEQWRAASYETRNLELGEPETTDFLDQRIRELRSRNGGWTVLVGGPPCQAYSLVGRARITGLYRHAPHLDKRNHLYKEYVHVLSRLQPAAAVMENVKGMLSSTLNGRGIFGQVMSDLRDAGYRLYALSPPDGRNGPQIPSDFVVRAEEHGIPQARHRIFIVCLRRDIAEGLPRKFVPRLQKRNAKVTVDDIIGEMPRLRSGLSRADEPALWQQAVREGCTLCERHHPFLSEPQENKFHEALSSARRTANCSDPPAREADGGVAVPDSCPADLRDWLRDEALERLPNNQTRGHMTADLARYIFASAFGRALGRSPKTNDFPPALAPDHKNWKSGKFADRYRVQLGDQPARTITSHISKDGHYFIHPDTAQCRSLTVREAARLQTFPDNYFFMGNRTQQYVQVGNAVPPFLAHQIADNLWNILEYHMRTEEEYRRRTEERDKRVAAVLEPA